jgi:hypothetical protein
MDAAAALCTDTGPAEARDGDEVRGYLGLRGFGSNPGTDVHDYWGASLGANFNRYVGAEVAADIFERRLKVGNLGTMGEYGVAAVVPQIRLRYPLFEGRLTPCRRRLRRDE